MIQNQDCAEALDKIEKRLASINADQANVGGRIAKALERIADALEYSNTPKAERDKAAAEEQLRKMFDALSALFPAK